MTDFQAALRDRAQEKGRAVRGEATRKVGF